MLPSSSRLPKRLFSSFVRGNVKDNQYFSVVFSRDKTDNPRVACVVSKKVSPLATKRNLFRRRMYEAVREVGVFKFKSHVIIYLKKPGAVLKKKDMAELLLPVLSS
ncbi:MAG: ribonuclease P protein component [Patescibacteria group bacterium]